MDVVDISFDRGVADFVETHEVPGDAERDPKLVAHQLAIAIVEPREFTEPDDAVAHPPTCEIHHRVADVPELEIQYGDEMTVLVMELTRVPHDRAFTTVAARLVPVEPPEEELHQRI